MADANTQNIQELCKISVCPPEEHTDFDSIITTGMDGGSDSPEYFVIEFGSKSTAISVTVGQHIAIDDIIAYMREIPVKSKISGEITEVHEKYIVGKYETDYNAILESFGITSETTEEEFKSKFGIE